MKSITLYRTVLSFAIVFVCLSVAVGAPIDKVLPTKDVRVVNPEDQPAIVYDVGADVCKRTVYNGSIINTAELNGPNHFLHDENELFVPEGSTFVVETVSATAMSKPHGFVEGVWIELEKGSTIERLSVLPLAMTYASDAYNLYSGCEQVRVYVDQNAYILGAFFSTTSDSGDFVSGSIYLSGYFVSNRCPNP
jgi:hypothetical protein